MQSAKPYILLILGSTRTQSANRAIVDYIATHFSAHAQFDIYDKIDLLPHFNPDLDNDTPPLAVLDFRKRLQAADGVLFCTPEYVFSLPGSLKNAIDWQVSTTLFSGKPVGLIVASASGEKAMASLALILSTIEAEIPETAKLIIRGAKGKISSNGEINHKECRDQIDNTVQKFLDFIRQY